MTDPARTTASGLVLVTLDEAARKLSVPIGTLYSWKSRHEITPAAIAPGGKALFQLDEIARRARKRKPRGAGHA